MLTSPSGYEDLSAVTKEILKFVTNKCPEMPCFLLENGANMSTLSAPAMTRSPEVKNYFKMRTSRIEIL